ncbi:histidine phosphatase family protein [Sphingobium limneticum]|jgi:broad specificity phosphatase PhoE|uniref:Histidine phosphatase family protein n=1 Tax=Sphingobium limneticum TaxID=1007511 RepID=A0A5J5HST4_9SPHN|nr:histidine phosphatase family protein [Sphingobium limneticum]KAA9013334.1 histidine phosphatase family protein [Sphingobium limneticum]KAA9025640.1 histidine phosphatase family protein [Sphingobium limneticum]
MLTTSLLLLCAGPTRASRQGGFPAIDEALDEGGQRDAAALVLPVRFRDAVQSSPTLSAIETAQAMGVTPLPQPALRDIDHGRWAGHDFATIATEEPEALAQWLADPARGGPDGESLHACQLRVGGWLDALAATGASICALTHPMPIRAAIAHALAMPLRASLSIDIAPLSRTTLSFNGRWRLQSLEPG